MGLMFGGRRAVARLAAGAAMAGIAAHAGKRRAEQDRCDEQIARVGATGLYPPAPRRYVAPPPASTGGEVDELSRLVQMHDSGALTDEEFVAAKAQVLGM